MTATLPDWAQWLQLGLSTVLVAFVVGWFFRGER